MATPRRTPKKPAAKKPAAKKPAAKKPAAKKPATSTSRSASKPAAVRTPGAKRSRRAAPDATRASPVALRPVGAVPEVTLRESGEGPALVYRAAPVTPPKGATLEGHGRFVQALAFSPDSRHLITGSEDGTLRVWEVATGQCVQALTEHTSAVNCVCFAAGGTRLVSASDDSTLKVWNPETWAVERTLTGTSGYVSEVHPAGDGRVVSSGNDGSLRLWDLATGACIEQMDHGSWVNALDASADGRFAVASSTDNVMRVWDLATGEVARTLVDASSLNAGTVMGLIVAAENRSGVGHGSFARHVAWSRDGARFYSSSKELIEWDAATGAERSRLDGDGWEITGFAFLPEGREVVVAGHDAVFLYDFGAKRRVAELPFAHGGNTHMVAVSPDGRYVACGSEQGPVGLWALDDLRAAGLRDRHITQAFSVAVSSDGAFALTGGSDRTARWRDLASNATSNYAFSEGLFVSPMRFTRDGRRALVMNDKATMVVLDARTGAPLGTARFPDHEQYRPFLKLHELRDGRWLVGSVGGPLTVWDLDALDKTPERFTVEAGHVVALDVDPEEQVAVTSQYHSDGLAEVQAWNLSDRTLRWHAKIPTQGYASGARIVGARVAVSTSKGALLILSLHDGALLHALEVSRDEFIASVVVTGPAEVVLLAKSPARVDLTEGRVTERIASVPDHYYVEIEGERRALRITAESVAECDLVERTVTAPVVLGRVASITPTPASPFIALAPMTPELVGSVIVLRRSLVDPYAVQSPTLERYESPTAKKPAAKKPATSTSRSASKPAAVRTPGAKPAAKKKPAAKRRGPPKWVATWAPPESGVTYRWGSWTFVLVDSRQDVVFWNDGAHMAFEFVAMSNGWWHLLTGGKEYVIWSAGGGSPQALYAKPWTEPLPAKVVEVRSGQRFEICRGGHGTTLAFDDDALRVTFYDKRVLTIPSDNEAIEFDGRRSERIYGQSV